MTQGKRTGLAFVTAIAKSVVAARQGKITIASEVQRGTTVEIRLPTNARLSLLRKGILAGAFLGADPWEGAGNLAEPVKQRGSAAIEEQNSAEHPAQAVLYFP